MVDKEGFKLPFFYVSYFGSEEWRNRRILCQITIQYVVQ